MMKTAFGSSDRIDHVLGLLPDEPRYVEARGMLRRGDATILAHRHDDAPANHPSSQLPDCVVRGIAQPLAVIIGLPAVEIIHESIDTGPVDVEVLCHQSQQEWVASALHDWRVEGAVFHTLPAGISVDDAAPRADAVLRVLEPSDAAVLTSLPSRLRQEMQTALRISPVVAAIVQGCPASLAYSPAMTERWFDIAVETISAHQRRGLAELVSRRLISMVIQRGLRPVWGAVDSNLASLALAQKLGFTAHDRLVLFTRPRGAGRHRRS